MRGTCVGFQKLWVPVRAQLQRLVLWHEDAMGVLSAELSYVCFVKLNVAASIAPSLYTAQKASREMKAHDPSQLSKPMRCALLSCMFRKLLSRVQNLEHDKETQDKLRKMQWLADAGWQYLDCSSEKKVLMKRDGEAAVSMADTQQLIEDLGS